MNRAQIACLLVVVAVLSGVASAQSVESVTQTIQIGLLPMSHVTSATAAALTKPLLTPWADYTGTTTVSFGIRTSSTTTGTMSVQGTTDFGGSGPKVASGDLTFTCGAHAFGTCTDGTVPGPAGLALAFMTFPNSIATGAADTTVLLNLAVRNKVSYKTGPYTAVLTFTISTT